MKKKAILMTALAAAAGVLLLTLYNGTHKSVNDLLGCTDPDEIARISVVASASGSALSDQSMAVY